MFSQTDTLQLSQGLPLDQRSSAKFRPDYPAEDEVEDIAMRSQGQYNQNYNDANIVSNNVNRHIEKSQSSSVPPVFQPSLPQQSNLIQESQGNCDGSTGYNEGYMRHAQTMQDQIKQILEAQQRQIDQAVTNHKRSRGVATFPESPEDFQPIDELSRESSIGATARSAQAGNEFMRSQGAREKSVDSKPKRKEVRSNSLRPQSAKKLKGMIEESADFKGNNNKLGYSNTKTNNNTKSKALPLGSDANSKSSAQTCYELVLDFKYNGKKISKTMVKQNPLLNSMPTSASNKQQQQELLQQQDCQQATFLHNQNTLPSKPALLVPPSGSVNPETEAAPSPLTASNSLFLRLSPRKKGQLASPSGTLLSGSVSGISNQSSNSELASFKRQITSLIASENEIKALITPTTPIRLNHMPQQRLSEQSALGNSLFSKQEIVSNRQQQQKQMFSQEKERKFSGQNEESLNEGINLSERKRKLGGSQKQVVIQTEIIAQPAENALMQLHNNNNSTPNKANLNHVPKKPCLKQPTAIKFPISCFEKPNDLAEDNPQKQEMQQAESASEQVKCCFEIQQETHAITQNQGQQQQNLNSLMQEQGRVMEADKHEQIDQMIDQGFVGTQLQVKSHSERENNHNNQDSNQITAFNEQSNSNNNADSVNKYSQKYLQSCELSESKFTLRQQIEMKLLKAKQTKGASFQQQQQQQQLQHQQPSLENRNPFKNPNNYLEKQSVNAHNKSNDAHLNRFINESDQKSRRDTSREQQQQQQSSKSQNDLAQQASNQRDRDLQEKPDYIQQQQEKKQFSNQNSKQNKQERSNSLPKPSQQSLAQSALLRQSQQQQQQPQYQQSIPQDAIINQAQNDIFHRQPSISSQQSSQMKSISHEDDNTSNSHKSQSQLQRAQQPPRPPYSAISIRKTRADSNQESSSSENATQRAVYAKNPMILLPNQSPFSHNSSNHQNNSLNDSKNYNNSNNNAPQNQLLVRQSSEKLLPKTNVLNNSSNQYSKNYYNSSTERKSVMTLQKSNSNAQLPPKSFFYKPIGSNLLTNNNSNSNNAPTGYSRWNQSKTCLSHSLASPNGAESSSGQTLATQSQDSRSLLQMNIIERNQAWLSQRQMKNEQRKQEAQLKEIEGCTFKPTFRSSSPGQMINSTQQQQQQSQDEKQSIPPDSSRKTKESYHQVLGGSYFHSSANRAETLGYSQQFQVNQLRKASFGASNLVGGVQDKTTTSNKLVYPFNSNIQPNQQLY